MAMPAIGIEIDKHQIASLLFNRAMHCKCDGMICRLSTYVVVVVVVLQQLKKHLALIIALSRLHELAWLPEALTLVLSKDARLKGANERYTRRAHCMNIY